MNSWESLNKKWSKVDYKLKLCEIAFTIITFPGLEVKRIASIECIVIFR